MTYTLAIFFWIMQSHGGVYTPPTQNPEHLAIFFWIMHRFAELKRAVDSYSPCYFLLNYARGTHYLRCRDTRYSLPCYFLLNYARWRGYFGGSAWQERTCYFLLNYALPVQRWQRLKPSVVALLFSFELCREIDQCSPTHTLTPQPLAIFFWIMPQKILTYPNLSNVFEILLFSFELC